MAKFFLINCFSILLSIALLTFSFVAPMPMSIMEVGAMDLHHSTHAQSSTNQNNCSNMPSCDVIGSLCLLGVFITSELTESSMVGEIHQILNSNLVVKFILTQSASPPPKI
jgi:hypothetical protein